MRIGPRDDACGSGVSASAASPRGQRAVRRRLIRAASELFVEQGYRTTTTRAICDRADTAAPTLFRNFGSKAELFEASLAEPLSEFIDRWASSFAEHPAESPVEVIVEEFVHALLDFIIDNQALLKILIAADFDQDEDLQPVADRISARFASGLRTLLDRAGIDFAHQHDFRLEDPVATIAAEVSMALGMTLLQKWVFIHGRRPPGRARIAREITAMIVHGIAHR